MNKKVNITQIELKNYYPFGMVMGQNIEGDYRYGYQGENAEEEELGATHSFQVRLWDARIGRWLSVAPLVGETGQAYIGMGNNPINYIDPDGRCFQKVGDEYVPCDEADVGSTTTGAFGYDWTMTESNGWQLTNGADPCTVNYEYDYIEPSGEADYYTDRYKNHIEKYNTRPPDYYLEYGHKYINRFKNGTRAKLSELGKEWLDETAVELQVLMNEGILQSVRNNTGLQGDNTAFHSFAYGKHVTAYSGSGKIGKLKVPDLWHISMKPDFSDSFFSPDGRSQIIQMFPHILKGPHYPEGYWDPKKNPGMLKPGEFKF